MQPLVRKFSAVLAALLVVFLTMPLPARPARAAGPVTVTNHVLLGLRASVPISANPRDCLASAPVIGCVFRYNIAFSGTANISATIGADLELTYDPAALVPGGTVPVQLKYTPTAGGSTLSANLSGPVTISFTGCTNCPATLPITLASGSGTFTAPLGSAPSVTIPASSSTVTLGSPLGPIISASLASSLTLAPAAPGSLAGLGGAAAVIGVQGATGGPILPLEWDQPGQSLTTTLNLPVTAGGGIDITAGPLFHWLRTSGSVSLVLHWGSGAQAIFAIVTAGISLLTGGLSDPAPISLFAGGLGPVFKSIGLDTQIGNAVGPPAGSLVAARVALGFVPVPLTMPPLATIPPVTPGSTRFSIPGVSISGAPSAAILAGRTIALTARVGRGTAPFSFRWTRNGGAFAATNGITDTPPLGGNTYAVTVTDAVGAVSNTDSVTVNVYDFAVSVSPLDRTVLRNGSTTFTVAIPFLPGSAGTATATVSTSGLPGDATISGLPAALAVGGSATFTVQTGAASLGDFPFQITGTTTGSRSGTANLHLFDYVVTLLPFVEQSPFGASAPFTLSAGLTSGSSLVGVPTSVATSLTGLPPGATTTGFPVTLPLSTAGSLAMFTVDTASTTPIGDYTLVATGSTSFGSRAATAVLRVITPQQAVQNLIDTIVGMDLPRGVENRLLATLKNLNKHIDAGQVTPACNKLDAFIGKVNRDLARGRLTPDQASQLLLMAGQIEASIGC